MVGISRAGLGLLAVRRGRDTTRLRIHAELGHCQRGLQPLPRHFTRTPLRLRQQTGATNGNPLFQQAPNLDKGSGSMSPADLLESVTGFFGVGRVIDTMVALIGGVVYPMWYKRKEMKKIEDAFKPGNDPALVRVNHPLRGGEVGENGYPGSHIKRKEQEDAKSILDGKEKGHYFLFLGPKGTGKTTMMMDEMHRLDADGASICEVHPNLEVFRFRLGKALNYYYNEDSQMDLFQRHGAREGGAELDIERAMHKLEKAAIRRTTQTGRPLVMIFNNIHLLNNDKEGRELLQQLQQRAEYWAEKGIMTMVFISDDFWPYPVMRQLANRMKTVSVEDFKPKEALSAVKKLRQDHFGKANIEPDEILEEAAKVAGGRLAYMSKVARTKNLEKSIRKLKKVEKSWLLTNAGLIPDCDEDAMDEQKWASCTWLLLREFVKRRIAAEEKFAAKQAAQSEGLEPSSPIEPVEAPSIPYYECREIMTRSDLLDRLDSLNIISIDMHHDVRLDSMLTLEVAREIVMKKGFDELLEGVRNRIAEIERLRGNREAPSIGVSGGHGGWEISK